MHRNPTRDADPLEQYVGKWVQFTEPSVAYKGNEPFTVQNKRRGQVKRVLRGQLEVKSTSGGYHMMNPSEFTTE